MKKILIMLALISLLVLVGCSDTCHTSYEVYNLDGEFMDICEVKSCSYGSRCRYSSCKEYDAIEGSTLVKEVGGTC